MVYLMEVEFACVVLTLISSLSILHCVLVHSSPLGTIFVWVLCSVHPIGWLAGVFYSSVFSSLNVLHPTSHICPALSMCSLDTLCSYFGEIVLLCCCYFSVSSVFYANIFGKNENNTSLKLQKKKKNQYFIVFSWEHSRTKKLVISQTKFQPKFWLLW